MLEKVGEELCSRAVLVVASWYWTCGQNGPVDKLLRRQSGGTVHCQRKPVYRDLVAAVTSDSFCWYTLARCWELSCFA